MIDFPNQSRSYDPRGHRVRFWGHDGALEISFFLDEAALLQVEPSMLSDDEASVLKAFDAHRVKVLDTARKAYGDKRAQSCFLGALNG
jgi:hypothetical protein